MSKESGVRFVKNVGGVKNEVIGREEWVCVSICCEECGGEVDCWERYVGFYLYCWRDYSKIKECCFEVGGIEWKDII